MAILNAAVKLAGTVQCDDSFAVNISSGILANL
jgi:hypothetical protein